MIAAQSAMARASPKRQSRCRLSSPPRLSGRREVARRYRSLAPAASAPIQLQTRSVVWRFGSRSIFDAARLWSVPSPEKSTCKPEIAFDR